MNAPADWTEQDLLNLIVAKHEENLQLDFKRADSLEQSEKKKSEISKDVSAFANSAGGTIVYGIEESPDQPHYAQELSPIDASVSSKEWLEQVINSRIQPRLHGVLIKAIKLFSGEKRGFAYVVCIPSSGTAHQASDKKYYRRFNFESVPMEDYEIRQAMNRISHPAYKIRLVPVEIDKNQDRMVFRFNCLIENVSAIVGRDVSAVIFTPKHLVQGPDDYEEEFEGRLYTRLAGVRIISSYDTRSAVDSAHPLTSYSLTFQKQLIVPLRSLTPLQVIVRIFDQFGLAQTEKYSIDIPSLTILLTEMMSTDRAHARSATLA